MMVRQKRYIFLFISLAAYMTLGLSPRQDAQENPEALQKQLEKEFVAPCCWNEAVATHQSAAAEEVKGEIRTLLSQGKTRDDVRAYMVAKYGDRILIIPEAKGFNLMVWIFPAFMILAGLAAVIVYLRRSRPGAVAAGAVQDS